MERRHQGMDRPGIRQVPKGSGEQEKLEKTGCKIICGAPTTLAGEGLMMMMMMMMSTAGCKIICGALTTLAVKGLMMMMTHVFYIKNKEK